MAVTQQALNDYLAAVKDLDSQGISDPLLYAQKALILQLNYQAGISGFLSTQVSPSSGDRVLKEALTGTQDGSNATFTTQFEFIPGTEEVRINGITQENIPGTSCYFTTGTHTVVFTDSPLPSDYLEIDYTKQP
jgi:hypothetical protein